MTTISVLMSVYKLEKGEYLDRAFKSIWTDQSLKPTEIVLIEDGTLNIELAQVINNWRKCLGDKLIILQNAQNVGLTKSLNRGIQYIKSDFIARMDSDDISEPCRFERQVAYMEAHPEIDVLGGAVKEFDNSNTCLYIRHYPLDSNQCKKYILKASPLAHPAVMIRRRVFDAGICYNEKYRTCQDVALWFDLLSKDYKIANLPEIILQFRRNEALFSRRKSMRNICIEFQIYMKGIYSLQGLCSYAYIYPILRLLFRLMPVGITKYIYNGKWRKKMLH